MIENIFVGYLSRTVRRAIFKNNIFAFYFIVSACIAGIILGIVVWSLNPWFNKIISIISISVYGLGIILVVYKKMKHEWASFCEWAGGEL